MPPTPLHETSRLPLPQAQIKTLIGQSHSDPIVQDPMQRQPAQMCITNALDP